MLKIISEADKKYLFDGDMRVVVAEEVEFQSHILTVGSW